MDGGDGPCADGNDCCGFLSVWELAFAEPDAIASHSVLKRRDVPQVLRVLLAAAPGAFVGMERKWIAAMRAVLNAAAAAEPGFTHACAALGAISARATTMAAAVNARVLSYDEAEAVQVRQTVVRASWSAEWWTAWHLSKADIDKDVNSICIASPPRAQKQQSAGPEFQFTKEPQTSDILTPKVHRT